MTKKKYGYRYLYESAAYAPVYEYVKGGKPKSSCDDHGIIRERPGGRFYAYCDILGKVSGSMTLGRACDWFDQDHEDECAEFLEGEVVGV